MNAARKGFWNTPGGLIVCCIVGVPLLGLLFLATWWWTNTTRLNVALEELRRQGLPTDEATLFDFYKVAPGDVDTTEEWLKVVNAVRAANLAATGKHLPVIGMSEEEIPGVGEAWTDQEAVRTFLEAQSPLLAKIHAAVQLGGSVRFPISTMDPVSSDHGGMREVARLLSLDAYLATREGNCKRAFQDVASLLQLDDVLKNEVSFVNQLVRSAFHSVAIWQLQDVALACNCDDEQLRELQSHVLSPDRRDGMIRGLCGERASLLSMIDRVDPPPLGLIAKLEALRTYEEAIKALSGTWPEAIHETRNLSTRLAAAAVARNPLQRYSVRSLHAGSFESATNSSGRFVAKVRCANAGLAVLRHHLSHGNWPSALDQLDKGLLGVDVNPEEVLLDPFDGRPLRWKSDEKEILIYSIGEDLHDDGGQVYGKTTGRPLDVGFWVNK